jgi:hypothetical protein
MNLAKSAIALYNKYKKQLTLLVLVFFGYKIINHFFPNAFLLREGLVGATSCTQFTNCSQCVNGQVNNSNSPCFWSNQQQKCGSFMDSGYSRICDQPPEPNPPGPLPPGPSPPPGPLPPGPIIIPPGPRPTPSKCETISNCKTCINTDCFWGDSDQKCSTNFKAGYGKICSGSNPGPNPNCPKCEACPELTMLKIPTFITAQ